MRAEYAADRVNTFSTAMLGLTVGCARCHDHKFDPITQRDYYSLFAFFNSIDEYGLYNDAAHVPTAERITHLVRGPKDIGDFGCTQQEVAPLLLTGSALGARVVTGQAPPTRATIAV